jgi:hypothetical protein
MDAISSPGGAQEMNIAPQDSAALRRLDSAVEALRDRPARIKRAVLAAVLVTIRHDHEIRIEEIELFRAIAATLDVPAPPLAAGSVG